MLTFLYAKSTKDSLESFHPWPRVTELVDGRLDSLALELLNVLGSRKARHKVTESCSLRAICPIQLNL